MATHILNALTFRHDHDAAERTLRFFWDTQDLFDSELISEHISSQPLLAASLFFLILCSIGLIIFTSFFLTCRLRGHCGAQKFQAYPTNSNNYALQLMLFFLSWIVVTSASAYFVLAGSGFWSEKLDAQKPVPILTDNATVRLSRSVVSDLFADTDYHGDFENLPTQDITTPMTSLKRVHIRRLPIRFHKHKQIEIPMRPLAEVAFAGTSDKYLVKKLEGEEEEDVNNGIKMLQPKVQLLPMDEEIENIEEEEETTSMIPNQLVIAGHTMDVEFVTVEATREVEEYEEDEELITTSIATVSTTSTPTTTPTTTTTTTVMTTTTSEATTIPPPSSTTVTTTTTTLPTTLPTTPEITWETVEKTTKKTTVVSQILPVEDLTKHKTYHSLHSRFVVFICRLTFCFVALLLAFVVLPSFFFIVAGTGCYIYSDHPMNRSSISNRIGQIVSTYASILLFCSPIVLLFSTFALFYTHCHELLCAAIQLQHQQDDGSIGKNENQQILLETYTLNSAQCSRSLQPIQSLLLSSLLLCISILPCVFSMFKLVKYYFRMSSEFYWNAADNYAGRQYSKQQEFPRYQSTVIYPDDDMAGSYAVYGQI